MTSSVDSLPAWIYLHPFALFNAFGDSPDSDVMYDILDFCINRDSCLIGKRALVEFYDSGLFSDPVSQDPAFWTFISRLSGLETSPEDPVSQSVAETVVKYHSQKCESLNAIVLDDLSGVDASALVGIPSADDWWELEGEEEAPSGLYFRSLENFSDFEFNRFAFEWAGVSDLKSIDLYRASLFSNIVFSDGWLKGASSLVGDRTALSRKIYKHLCVLNDVVFYSWDGVVPEKRAAIAASQGVEMSPESPNTHKNSSAMRAHTYYSPVGDLSCEWHTKIDPAVNRIYFCWTPEFVFVGVLIDHLPV
ncbi:hypothetical protein [Corynebacterium glyciniphilum]|uniref:hypothetical protein n=1 Tax=Corynebacterium glyciniphilum TaxID=1404244 RepID=UPI003FD196A3